MSPEDAPVNSNINRDGTSTFEKIFYLPVLNDCYGGTLDFVNNIGPRD
jgi:hypothetical protein